MEDENIFQIKNIRLNILKFLIEPICKNCEIKNTNSWEKEYCEWCGFNIFFNIKLKN